MSERRVTLNEGAVKKCLNPPPKTPRPPPPKSQAVGPKVKDCDP